MRIYLIRTLFVLLALFVIATVYGISEYHSGGISQGETAPGFTEKTLDGDQLSLSDFSGKFVLLDFWGTWCGPCISETPNLIKAYNQYSHRVEFIGIPVNDDPQKVRNFTKKTGMNWPQLAVQTSGFRGSAIPWDYGVNSYPTLFLIDPNGQIIISSHEAHDRLQGEELIKTLAYFVN